MKFVEKKCPNCGANLEFKETDSSCKCDYCKREFVIERDESAKNKEIPDQFNLVYNQVEKTFKFVSIMHIVIFVFAFIIIAAIFVSIFLGFRQNSNHSTSFTDKSEEKDAYLTDVSQIENFDYSFIDTTSIVILGKEERNTLYFHKSGADKREKVYLASKDDGNFLIPVYRTIYTDGETSYTLYTPVVYENVRVGNVSFDVMNGSVHAPLTYFNLDHSEYATGYQDMDTLYEEVIKPYESDYTITEK